MVPFRGSVSREPLVFGTVSVSPRARLYLNATLPASRGSSARACRGLPER